MTHSNCSCCCEAGGTPLPPKYLRLARRQQVELCPSQLLVVLPAAPGRHEAAAAERPTGCGGQPPPLQSRFLWRKNHKMQSQKHSNKTPKRKVNVTPKWEVQCYTGMQSCHTILSHKHITQTQSHQHRDNNTNTDTITEHNHKYFH